MLEKKPLKTQFRIIFILIIVTSIMATIVTYCIWACYLWND